MNSVDEYMDQYDGEKKEWLATLVTFMRDNYPEIPETISYQIPTYKFNRTYIGFSAARDHFSFHTLDFDMIEELKTLLPGAKFGKGCAKISYKDTAAVPVLFDMCRKIVARNTAAGPKK